MDNETTTVKNRQTGETRKVQISIEHLEKVMMDGELDECTGPCECTVVVDGVCSEGWPSLNDITVAIFASRWQRG